MSLVVSCAFAALVALPVLAVPPNAIPDGNFDTAATIVPWQVDGPSVVESFSDASDASGRIVNGRASGAIEVENSLTNPLGATGSVSRCVAVDSPARYFFGAKVLVPASDATAYVAVDFYSGPGCTGTITQSALSSSVTGPTTNFIGVSASDVILADSGTVSARVHLVNFKQSLTGATRAYFDDVFLQRSRGCVANAQTLCLAGHFSVQAFYRTPDGTVDSAKVIQLTPDSGYLWFLTPNNPELLVKVLDVCKFGKGSWVFAGGLTNFGVTLTVKDVDTETVKTYTNALGAPFQPVQDTSAFACQ